MSGIEVRWATDEDIPEIFSLIKELAEFEKALDCVKTIEAQLASDLRAKHFVAVVATVPVSASQRTVGFALLHTRYSTWFVALSPLLLFSILPLANLSLTLLLLTHHHHRREGLCLHLEDLYVQQEYRQRGIGTLLIECCVKYTHSLGCKRLCWEVLDWNENAIRFYKKLGAEILDTWRCVRLSGDKLMSYEISSDQFKV